MLWGVLDFGWFEVIALLFFFYHHVQADRYVPYFKVAQDSLQNWTWFSHKVFFLVDWSRQPRWPDHNIFSHNIFQCLFRLSASRSAESRPVIKYLILAYIHHCQAKLVLYTPMDQANLWNLVYSTSTENKEKIQKKALDVTSSMWQMICDRMCILCTYAMYKDMTLTVMKKE